MCLSFAFCPPVFPEAQVFTVDALQLHLLRTQWNVHCDLIDLRQHFTRALPLFHYHLLLVHLPAASAEFCACMASPHKWVSTLLAQKNYHPCPVSFPAFVQCCSRAAIIVFLPELPVAICTPTLLPKGFASNKIIYLTT
jgi:hypothetical protein